MSDDTNTHIFKDEASATENHKKHFRYRSHTLVNEIKIIVNIPYPINGGTSICVLQRYVPILPCNGNYGAIGKTEDMLHSNMLQHSVNYSNLS